MTRLLASLTIALAALFLSALQFEHIAQASGGNNAIQTVALHRQGCPASGAGTTVGTARFSLDDQGGEQVNPNGIEIRTAVTASLPRTSYSVSLLNGACAVLSNLGVLNTDDSGRG